MDICVHLLNIHYIYVYINIYTPRKIRTTYSPVLKKLTFWTATRSSKYEFDLLLL
jgi:hypothetical protein